MNNLCIRFYNDEAGFVVSSELVLVCTVTVNQQLPHPIRKRKRWISVEP
jgi:hypothetical protein